MTVKLSYHSHRGGVISPSQILPFWWCISTPFNSHVWEFSHLSLEQPAKLKIDQLSLSGDRARTGVLIKEGIIYK